MGVSTAARGSYVQHGSVGGHVLHDYFFKAFQDGGCKCTWTVVIDGGGLETGRDNSGAQRDVEELSAYFLSTRDFWSGPAAFCRLSFSHLRGSRYDQIMVIGGMCGFPHYYDIVFLKLWVQLIQLIKEGAVTSQKSGVGLLLVISCIS